MHHPARQAGLLILALAGVLAAQPFHPVDEKSFAGAVAAHKGTVVLVNFWATWCGPCRVEIPLLARLEARLKPRGFVLLTVSADEPEDLAEARKFLKESGVGGAWYRKDSRDDDAFIRAVHPKWSGALPAVLLYDRQGRLAQTFFGETGFSVIEAAVERHLR